MSISGRYRKAPERLSSFAAAGETESAEVEAERTRSPHYRAYSAQADFMPTVSVEIIGAAKLASDGCLRPAAKEKVTAKAAMVLSSIDEILPSS